MKKTILLIFAVLGLTFGSALSQNGTPQYQAERLITDFNGVATNGSNILCYGLGFAHRPGIKQHRLVAGHQQVRIEHCAAGTYARTEPVDRVSYLVGMLHGYNPNSFFTLADSIAGRSGLLRKSSTPNA